VLHCTWNTFVFENFGWYNSKLQKSHFKSKSTVESIVNNIIRNFQGSDEHLPVDHIKVIVKQLTGHTDYNLTNFAAGALTEVTTTAVKKVCDSVMGCNSTKCE